jgi:hypothetical protein
VYDAGVDVFNKWNDTFFHVNEKSRIDLEVLQRMDVFQFFALIRKLPKGS